MTVGVLWLLFTVSWAGLRRIAVVFSDHTQLLFPKGTNILQKDPSLIGLLVGEPR